MRKAVSLRLDKQGNFFRELQEPKKVDIEQRLMVLLFLDLLQVFARRLCEKLQFDSSFAVDIAALREQWSPVPELAFKDIDGDVARLLKGLLAELCLQSMSIQKAAFVMEQEFQRTRSLESYHFVFDKLFLPFISLNSLANSKEILVPGCGKSNEIFWLAKRFPKSRLFFIDNNPEETAETLRKRHEIIAANPDEKTAIEERLRVECLDLSASQNQNQSLSQCEVLRSRSCDIFFFFHPYLIESNEFSALEFKIRQAKDMREQEQLAMQTPLSSSASAILRNLIDSLKDDGIGIFTFVEHSELLMFANFAAAEGLSLKAYKNHFAIRKLNCYFMDLKIPRVLEPRSYHYVAFVSKSHSSAGFRHPGGR